MQQDKLQSIIHRAQKGEARAFEELLSVYGNRLYGFFCRRCGDLHDAEDLLQELFLRLVKSIGRYDHKNRFEPWLYRVAVNLVTDRLRRSARQGRTFRQVNSQASHSGDPLDRLIDASPGPGELVARTQQNDRLQEALDRLPAQQREVLLLRYFSELSFKQIAEILGCPTGTVLARAHRALRKLRELLTVEGGPDGPASPDGPDRRR